MLPVPEAEALVLQETEPLPADSVPFQQAFQHVLAEDVLAREPVPGFRASIKVRACEGVAGQNMRASGCALCRSGRLQPRLGYHLDRQGPGGRRTRSGLLCHHRPLQDGYAVASSDGPGEYEIAFEAFAGVAPRTLSPGTVAYIGTGAQLVRQRAGGRRGSTLLACTAALLEQCQGNVSTAQC